MVTTSLQNTLSHCLADARSAEWRLAQLLPELANAAGRTEIWQAIHRYSLESAERAKQLGEQMGEIGPYPDRRELASIVALLEECHEAIAVTDDSIMRDALILATGKRLAHCQIASYETLVSLAKVLGEEDLVSVLSSLLKDQVQKSVELKLLADTVVYLPQRELNETS